MLQVGRVTGECICRRTLLGRRDSTRSRSGLLGLLNLLRGFCGLLTDRERRRSSGMLVYGSNICPPTHVELSLPLVIVFWNIYIVLLYDGFVFVVRLAP